LQLLNGAAAAIPFWCGCYVMWQISTEYNDDLGTETPVTRRYVYALLAIRAAVLALPILCLAIWYKLCFYDGLRGSFFRFRVFCLDFSVSPIWPLLFAIAGLFIVAAFHLRRLTW